MKNKNILFTMLGIVILFSYSCTREDEEIVADYNAPRELPTNLVTGTPLSDRILELYENYGIIVYTDTTIGDRMYQDLVSEEGLQMEHIPADTAAAIFYINMIEDEFIKKLPEDKFGLIFRNFYLYKNELSTGSGPYNQYDYISHVWYNSNSDLTVGGIDNITLDTVMLKQTFYYGLSTVLREIPVNTENFYRPFVDLMNEAAVYYWQVNSLEDAYEKGFLSANQNLIKSDQQDFDLFAAWAATVDPVKRDSLLNEYSLLRSKYQIVTEMFRQEGIPLEEVNEEWQLSPYNPDNN